ncbi:MAG: hypothetical protein IJ560_00550 [Alphaproteobacteria bacterium]|nr:hypothetical protein [Alphaproteobacteria bacterium]
MVIMKRLATCFFAILVCAPHVFAADVPSRVVASGATNNSTAASSRASTGRSINIERTAPDPEQPVTTTQSRTASRAIAGATFGNGTSIGRDVQLGITTPARTVSTRVANQSGTNVRSALDTKVPQSGRNARVNAASINASPTVRRAGLTLRPSTAEVGGRAVIGDTGVQTGSNIASEIRNVSARAAAATPTRESIAAAKERLEQTAELNKSCQDQYNECMDQFCAVIDANQKRCSCSGNLARYTKVENAVKEANTELNDVAQRIRYVGLSADEIRAIMTATEAEETLSSTKDTSETRSMLDDIEKLIKDPTSSASYYADTSTSLDLDLDFTSNDVSDMFNLDFLSNDSGSFSNLRGRELYNAAKKRCNTVLNQCKEVGATSTQITGNYDLAIDKDCIAYEQGLTKMNETLVSNVRSANRMLQKARLAVMQNKNQYDAKGCVAALDTCMTDDMVCGGDYYKCLDPTKRYIDENGEVVLGQNISDITVFMQNYNNASITAGTLSANNNVSITTDFCRGTGNDGTCNVKYLMTKIGTGQKVTDNGMCRAVLDKCQQYTYDSNGNYKPFNDIVVNYVQRAMVNIKAAQQSIIAEYASKCISDIATCYNKQVSQVNTWASSASVNGIYNVMTGACRNVALTCSYAVFAADEDLCPKDTAGTSQSTCLQNISEMFYQSLLCPDNSTYSVTSKAQCTATTGASCNEYVNDRCTCDKGYVKWGSSCLIKCGIDASYDAYGTCKCNDTTKTYNAATSTCS